MRKILSIIALVIFINPIPVFADQTGTLLPVADGTYKNWSPKTGTLNFAMVDEAICNGQSDYTFTQTVGSRDSYALNLTAVPNGSTITAINITPCASRNSNSKGGSVVLDVFYRLNNQNSTDLGLYNLSGAVPRLLAPTMFSNLGTVKTSSSTLEIGAVLKSGTKGARLSQLSGGVNYTPLYGPSNLIAESASSSAFLNWTDNSVNEDGFKVERSTDSAHFVNIASTSANVNSLVDPGLTSGLYYYRVKSFNIGADSSYSNTAAVTIF